MNLRADRREFASHCSARERGRYDSDAGLRVETNFEPLEDHDAELWTRQAIDGLRRALDETSSSFETERAGLQNLVAAAHLNNLEPCAGTVTKKLARCIESTREDWKGTKVTADVAAELIDIWNTASRYKVEELASLVGVHELSFDLLADDLRMAVSV